MLNIRKLRSSQLDSAIYAMILGDGCIQLSHSKNGNCNLKIGHNRKQKEYLLWKRTIIDSISQVKSRYWEYEKQNASYIETNALKYFTKLEKIFYTNRNKKITQKILNKLSDLSLAIWFMDDGYMSYNNSGSVYGELCVDQFSFEEVKLIQKWFLKKFNMQVGIRELRYLSGKQKGTIAYRIKLNKENCIKLSKFIYPYTSQIECMKYKLYKNNLLASQV